MRSNKHILFQEKRKVLSSQGVWGSTVKLSGTENPRRWGLKLEKTFHGRGGYGHFL